MCLELHRQIGAKQGQLLLDLRRVTVFGDLVGQDVLAGERQVRSLVERAARSGDALLCVDHDVAEQSRARQRRESQHGSRGVAAGVRDDRRAHDLRAVQLGQPVHRLIEQLRAWMRPVPPLVGGKRGEAKVGAQIDHPHSQLAQHGDGRRGGGVRIGHDRRVDALQPQSLELLDLERHPVARIQGLERAPGVRAPRHGEQLEAGVPPQKLGRQRAGEAGGAGDNDPRRTLAERLRAPAERLRGAAHDVRFLACRARLSHAAHPRAWPARPRSARARAPRLRRRASARARGR